MTNNGLNSISRLTERFPKLVKLSETQSIRENIVFRENLEIFITD